MTEYGKFDPKAAVCEVCGVLLCGHWDYKQCPKPKSTDAHKKRGTIEVTLKFAGRGKPLPIDPEAEGMTDPS
jgi:hypothetical protein